MNFWIKFCVLNLFLEDIHLILFLPKISCASTKLSTQLSETVEESFSSDITRTHCYKTAILNNVARSMSTGNDITCVCGDLGTKRYTSTGSVYTTPMTPRSPTLPEFGQELKVSRSSLLQRIRIHDILSREGLLIKRYWLVFLMLVEVSFLPRYFLKRFCTVLKWF